MRCFAGAHKQQKTSSSDETYCNKKTRRTYTQKTGCPVSLKLLNVTDSVTIGDTEYSSGVYVIEYPSQKHNHALYRPMFPPVACSGPKPASLTPDSPNANILSLDDCDKLLLTAVEDFRSRRYHRREMFDRLSQRPQGQTLLVFKRWNQDALYTHLVRETKYE
jgi:hypothetical protein